MVKRIEIENEPELTLSAEEFALVVELFEILQRWNNEKETGLNI